MKHQQHEVTGLITQAGGGDAAAADRLMPIVYDELRAVAGAMLREERADHTLQATALVNEAYLRLVDQTKADWRSESYFRAIAATMMERVLIDHARTRKRAKRGGGRRRVPLTGRLEVDGPDIDLLELSELLDLLKELDEQQYRLAQLRLFGGMDQKQAAKMLGLPLRTAQRDWQMAKAWLRSQLQRD